MHSSIQIWWHFSRIPPPQAPPFYRIPSLATDAFGLAIVGFVINISLGKLFAKKYNYNINPNQELIVYGVKNIAVSFLNCFASAASMSRTMVQEGVGCRTQVGVITRDL